MAGPKARHYWTALVISAAIAESAHAPCMAWGSNKGDVTLAQQLAPAKNLPRPATGKHLPGWLTIESFFSSSYAVEKPKTPSEKRTDPGLLQAKPPILFAPVSPVLADANPSGDPQSFLDQALSSVPDSDVLPENSPSGSALTVGNNPTASNLALTPSAEDGEFDSGSAATGTAISAPADIRSPGNLSLAFPVAVPEPQMFGIAAVAATLLLGRGRRWSMNSQL